MDRENDFVFIRTEYEKQIIKEMTMLLNFRIPTIVFTDDKPELDYVWINKEAEQLFMRFSDMLHEINVQRIEEHYKRYRLLSYAVT